MCGRFTKLYTWRELLRLLNLTAATPPFEGISPSWNVAPSQSVPVVRTNEHGETVIETMRWGFTPAWALSIPPPINARSETVATSPMFREAFKSRRCLVPASGFYEWRPGPTARAPKQAFYIRLLNDPLLCFAGLWEPPHAQAQAATFCLLTTQPNALMAKIHDRMPVILPSSTHVDWLAAKPLKREVLLTYQAPFPAEEMHSHPVGSAVNKVSNNDPSLTNATNDQPQSLWTLEG